VLVVTEEIGAVEKAELGHLLRHFESGHGAHFEVAALHGGHFGALAEERAREVQLHVELGRRLLQLGLEDLHGARQEVGRRRGRGKAQR